MSEHLVVFALGLFIGIFVAVLSIFVTNDKPKQKNTAYRGSTKSKGPNKSLSDPMTPSEMKRELKRLQAEIDAAHSKRGTSTSISSGSDYQSALDELDIDYYDRINALSSRDCTDITACGNSKETSKLKEKLNVIDKKLESDDKEEIKEALDELKDLCFNNPENVELLYRIGRAHVVLSIDQPEDVVQGHVEKGIEALSIALELNDKHAEVHKWYSILLGLRCQFQPLQQKAQDGLLLKKHCELACALKPDDPLLHYILGKFDFEVASLGWVQKLVFTSIVGEAVDSTYTDALKRFMTAENLSRGGSSSVEERVENKMMIGNTLAALGDDSEAEQWFREARLLKSGKTLPANKC